MTHRSDVKVRAVELHTEQAQKFVDRYRLLERDPYTSTFTYGRHKIECLIERETRSIPPGSRALDVGCGTGFNVARLLDRGFDTVGVEPADGMRSIARANVPGAEIVDGDFEHLPFPDQSFDLLLAIEVLRYLPGPDLALREAARVLRTGGMAIVTAAPRWSLNGYALVNVVTSRRQVPSFTRVDHSFVSARGGRAALRRAGFRDADVHGVFLGPWHALGRVSPRALSATLRAFEPVDEALADRWPWRDLANHLVLVGRT